LGTGNEIKLINMKEMIEANTRAVARGRITPHASLLRDAALKRGAEENFDAFEKAWLNFRDNGGLPAISLKWGDGMGEFGDTWEIFAKAGIHRRKVLCCNYTEDVRLLQYICP
jgi:hypothetical protein